MLKSTPEYVSAYVREFDNSKSTALAREALAHRRAARWENVRRFVAPMYRTSRFGKDVRRGGGDQRAKAGDLNVTTR